jgi:hypothetical protein
MQISAMTAMPLRTGPLSSAPPRPAATPGTVLSSQQTPSATGVTGTDAADPPRPALAADLTQSDRAAVATSTGIYLAPDGGVVPDTTPPWAYIARFVQQRHREVSEVALASIYGVPATAVSTFDVRA